MSEPHFKDALGKSVPLSPPLYQSSVYALPDLDALDGILDAAEPGFVYARDSHPNAKSLAHDLAKAEGAAWAVVTGSGMGAISACLLSLVRHGDRVVASNRLYGRTTQLLVTELSRYEVLADFIDTTDLDEVRAALATPARMLLVETISNPLLRLADIAALAPIARKNGCALVVDNTFATPVLYRPLVHGADVVIESLTKMMGGHSDLTLGLICGNDDGFARLTTVTTTWGLMANPFECWLAHRSLETMTLRVRTASRNAATLAEWLSGQPGVLRVDYPGLPNHPDHVLARRTLENGFGNMLCFELSGGREAVNLFLRRAPGLPFSPSLGHTTSTCSHPYSTSHRHVTPEEKQRQGITEGLVRVSVGIEDFSMIQDEFVRGLC